MDYKIRLAPGEGYLVSADNLTETLHILDRSGVVYLHIDFAQVPRPKEGSPLCAAS